MKFAKSFISVLLALIMTVLSPAVFAADSGYDDFVPVFRFVAASDSHVRDDSDVTADRIRKMLEMSYEIADSDPYYNGLDALLMAGDLTHDGTTTEFDKFAAAINSSLREGTQFMGVVAKNHDGYEMKHDKMREYYTSVTSKDADFHVVVGGFHFIGISTSPKLGLHYDSAQLTWLNKQLKAATADDPDSPVFVMHHEHNVGTVYGSSVYDGWGVPYFNAILSQFPQVVDFSGHSHYPLNDPRSIWQGCFTALGTGALYYSEFTIDLKRTYHPSDAYDTATFWIAELDADNNMRLTGYDVVNGGSLCEYYLDNPADPANREYTPEKRKAASTAPVFPQGAEPVVETTDNACTVTVPLADPTDGMPVVLYRIRAVNAVGMTSAKSWTLPKYYNNSPQDSVVLSLDTVPAGDYTLLITAETAYGVQSEPLEISVTIEGDNFFINFFAKLRNLFNNIINFFKDLF